ncbi:hypothetical protein ROZALSC1DRAFT_14613 [Rozella allomycis CSF55]|uniref:Uncharacterized protein n=1 Tax=Rozella allomycis (strain CSF55) TaxID=988480 RepID=A0A4V1IZR0_ROZAC|nr:hypothetical protein ROZALSC1DRAFT_14613 [Rozella allomycis CSF55]
MADCLALLSHLQEPFNHVNENLYSPYVKLCRVRATLYSFQKTGMFTLDDVTRIQKTLHVIENTFVVDGKFQVPGSNEVLAGQAVIFATMNACYKIAHRLLIALETIEGEMLPVYESLVTYKREMMAMKQGGEIEQKSRWSLDTATDLVPIQKELLEIEALKKDGKFMVNGAFVVKGQREAHQWLNRCYRLFNSLLACTETVDPSLSYVHQNLLTLRRSLMEFRRISIDTDGTFETNKITASDLMHWRLRLSSIYGLLIDGKFYNSKNQAPAGQSILAALLHQCNDILQELFAHVDEDDAFEDNEEEAYYEGLPVLSFRN